MMLHALSITAVLTLSLIDHLRVNGLLPSSISHHRFRHRVANIPRRRISRTHDEHHQLLSDTNVSLFNLLSSKASSEWDNVTLTQLKSELKNVNLPISGSKQDLIRRLEHHRNNRKDSNAIINTKKTSYSTKSPPKDELEIQVTEKEVQETVRILESLKFGNSNATSSKSMILESTSYSSTTHRISRQQKQEQQLMQSLKESLRQSPRTKSSTSMSSDSTTLPLSMNASAGSDPADTSTTQQDAKKLQQYTEQLRMRAANDLKLELSSLGLPDRGRKPDLVNRLAEYYVSRDAEQFDENDFVDEDDNTKGIISSGVAPSESLFAFDRSMQFAGIPNLSASAAMALHRAFGTNENPSLLPKPTPIQEAAIPYLFYPPHPSALLHAPTGSGKTIAYLLPITETLWREVENKGSVIGNDANDMQSGMAIILLPTRELAAQVAGVASVLAPPGMVRLITGPMDLMQCWKKEVDRGEEYEYFHSHAKYGTADAVVDTNNSQERKYKPRILLGSAKAIGTSLFGDAKLPGTPTRKPEGKELLSCVRWLVMDECDRLLNVEKSRSDKKSRRHEKPAALLAAAIARLTLGRAQVIAVSATIGRPLRRELSRVLGLHSSECPVTIRGADDAARWEQKNTTNDDDDDDDDDDKKHVGRAVKIPDTVSNYVLPVDGSTSGSLLIAAAFASKSILRSNHAPTESNRKVLVVLTRNCGIKVQNALGALRHFGIQPEPQSLLDALEADGTDRLVEAHRRVSQVEGVGGGATQPRSDKKTSVNEHTMGAEGYLLIAHEDNVRGLHLSGLDAVIVVGRPGSPDEYTHIAGRTGRAGRRGSVLNVVSFEQAAALASWTKMLGINFLPVEESEIAKIVDG